MIYHLKQISCLKPSAPYNSDSDEDVKVNGNLIEEKEIGASSAPFKSDSDDVVKGPKKKGIEGNSDAPIDIDSSNSEAPIVIASCESDVSLDEKVKSSFAAGDSCIKIDNSYDEILKGIKFFWLSKTFLSLTLELK
uniref:Uncharacterized protein n=1 Tax=Panagrolaimus davidi TaxID=227884 RepID=A0A914PDN7_9BILA